MTKRRRLAGLAVLALILLSLQSTGASAKDFRFPSAAVSVRVNPDGTVDVTESITFAYNGEFHGAWRDIPLAEGEQIPLDSISVGEAGRNYAPGGTTVLGSPGPSNTFAAANEAGGVRIVWRFDAKDEQRTFLISYRFAGVLAIFGDVADLNLRIWGDQWPAPLDRLTADVVLPRAVKPEEDPTRVRVWGHPQGINGSTTLKPGHDGATLQATGVPAHRWVSMRVVFPSSLLNPDAAGRHRDGQGLEQIVQQEQADAQRALDQARQQQEGNLHALEQDRLDREREFADLQRRQAQERRKARQLRWLVPAGIVASVVPSLAVFFLIAVNLGRDRLRGPKVDYVREPPSKDSPALVGALLEEGQTSGTREFLATFFDLVRRGYFEAKHERFMEKRWMGLREEMVFDLSVQVSGKSPRSLKAWEAIVYDAIEPLVPSDQGLLLSDLPGLLQEDAVAFRETFIEFLTAVEDEVDHRGWIDYGGHRARNLAMAGFGILGAAGVVLGALTAGNPVLLTAGIAGLGNLAIVFALSGLFPRALVRRSKDAADLAEKWRGLARYMSDFSMMEQAPPASVVIWEEHLVYAIVLGVAHDILRAAHLLAPEALAEESSLYWIAGDGLADGGRLTWMAIDTLSSGIQQAVAAGVPAASRDFSPWGGSSGFSRASSGFGGGFTGGSSSFGGGGSSSSGSSSSGGGGGGSW